MLIARSRVTRGVAALLSIALIIPLGSVSALACTPPDEPFNIEQVAVFGGDSAPRAVDVVGATAFVADGEGLTAWDVTDPSAASSLGAFGITGGALDVFVVGDVAYVVGVNGNVYVVDVADPAAMSLLDVVEFDGDAIRVVADAARLYVAASNGIRVYSASDPAMVDLDAVVETPEPVADVLVDGDTLYSVYSYYTVAEMGIQCVPSNVVVFDVSGLAPVELARHEVPYGHASLALSGGRLYVAISHPDGGGSGLKVFDVSSFGTLTYEPPAGELDYVSYIGLESYGALDVAVDGTDVYLAGLNNTTMWDLADLGAPYMAGLHTDGSARLDFEGGLLFGANEELGVLVFEFVPTSERSLGASRYDTAVDVSKKLPSAECVVVATGMNYPDALAGAPLAYALGAPVLLSDPRTGLSSAARGEVTRLGASSAIILGGTGVVPAAVQTQLVAAGVPAGNIERIAGSDRYDTARKIALRLQSELGGADLTEAFVATGENFPDALAASGVAAKLGAPVLLVGRDRIPTATSSALGALGVTGTYVLGGPSAISDAVVAQLPSPTRLAGGDRYGTAKAVADWAVDASGAGFDVGEVIVATGSNFPDALSSGVLGAMEDAPTLLVHSDVPAPTSSFLGARKAGISALYVIGGTSAVSTNVERVLVSLIK